MTWLAVGLGNPGPRFENTRHNAGARALQRVAGDLDARLKAPGPRLRPGKPQASVAETSVAGDRLVLARPATFMNESGRPVAALLNWFKIETENLIVLHDEIDLGAGALRVKFGGGSAGHHGVSSIVKSAGTPDFFRIRIGVGRGDNQDQAPADFVLEQMGKHAEALLAETEARAAGAVLSLIDEGLDATVARFNSGPARQAGSS